MARPIKPGMALIFVRLQKYELPGIWPFEDIPMNQSGFFSQQSDGGPTGVEVEPAQRQYKSSDFEQFGY